MAQLYRIANGDALVEYKTGESAEEISEEDYDPMPINAAEADLDGLIVFIPRDSTVPRGIDREKHCRLLIQPTHR